MNVKPNEIPLPEPGLVAEQMRLMGIGGEMAAQVLAGLTLQRAALSSRRGAATNGVGLMGSVDGPEKT